MTVTTKICGIKTLDEAQAAAQGGAAFLGHIHFPKSPRHLELSQMAALIAQIRDQNLKIKSVAVLVDPNDEMLQSVAHNVRPDYIQLHGKETPARVKAIGEAFGIPLIKALSVEGKNDLLPSEAFAPYVAYLLYDARAPEGAALPGGLGLSFDWSLLDSHISPKPYFLAGGLKAQNIRQALSLSGASHIDISSGVETRPGEKDVKLISDFLNVVKTL